MKYRIPIVLISMVFLGLYSANVHALPEGAMARLGNGAIGGTDRAIAFSPDGETLALATVIGIRLYETATLQEAGFLETEVRMYSVAFSPDGNLLAGGSYEGAKLWKADSLQEVTAWTRKNKRGRTKTHSRNSVVFRAHTGTTSSVAFTPDGKILAGGGADGMVTLWNLADLQEMGTLSGASDSVTSIAFSPNSQLMACGIWDSAVKLWDMDTNKKIATLEGHSDFVGSVAFNADSSLLASGSWDGSVKLWDVESRQELDSFLGLSEGVNCIAFSPDGRLLAGGGWQVIKLWDVESRQEIATLRGHLDGVDSIAFSPDGRLLASWGFDNAVYLWNIETHQKSASLILTGHSTGIESISFSADSSLLASAGDYRTIKLWDVGNRREVDTIRPSGRSEQIVFSPKGRLLARACNGIELWDMGNRRLVSTLRTERPQKSVSFSPDGHLIAGGGFNNINIWDVETHQELTSIDRIGAVDFVAFSHDGKLLACASRGSVQIRDAEKLQDVIATLPRAWSAIAFSPDGKLIATQGTGVKLWDADNYQEIAELTGRMMPDISASLCFSPDSSLLFHGGRWGVRIWDTGNAQEIATLTEAPVTTISLSPDGRLLATASHDGTILLWDMKPYISVPENVQPGGKLMATWGDLKVGYGCTELGQNFPNPFNPETWIPYQLAEGMDILISIYDASGYLVKTLYLGHRPAGFYTTKSKAAYWDGKNEAGEHVSSGIYFYNIQAGEFTTTKKMVVAH